MEIHVRGIGADAVADAPPLMLHAEVFDLVPQRFQVVAEPEYVCLRPAVRVEKLIDKQDLHLTPSGSALGTE